MKQKYATLKKIKGLYALVDALSDKANCALIIGSKAECEKWASEHGYRII